MNQDNYQATLPFKISKALWDAWCITSFIGIWPRFIEPNLISTIQVSLPIPNLPKDLSGLKIIQFSDLHLSSALPNFHLKNLINKISKLSPDLIVFTGDFLCYGILQDSERLENMLKSLHAPYGCYAVLGNHDYAQAVSINENGEYDIAEPAQMLIVKGLQRLFNKVRPKGCVTERARAIGFQNKLLQLINRTHFQLLHNTCVTVPICKSKLNICGLGEYMLGQCLPEIAYKFYDERFPGIILAHNPDSISLLKKYPGDIILSGHTHGGQIYLPWIWKKLTALENMKLRYGLKTIDGKQIYISSGIGSIMPFRCFARPEILLLTMETSP